MKHAAARPLFRSLLPGLAIVAALLAAWFTVRSYRSFIVLQTAFSVGVPASSGVRGWMSLRYLARTFKIGEDRLTTNLGLANEPSTLDADLRTLAARSGTSVLQYVQKVQRALADSGAADTSSRSDQLPTWYETTRDRLQSSLREFGYPALATTLVLGAIGLPVPSGLLASMAGSLSSTGQLTPSIAFAIIVTSSVLADLLVYLAGRRLGGERLDRYGRWVGINPQRREALTRQFARWGALMILLSRTLVSSLCTAVSLIAGISSYKPAAFLALVVAGRTIWSLAYFGLGYLVNWSFEAASGFLTNLSGAVFCALLAGIALLTIARK